MTVGSYAKRGNGETHWGYLLSTAHLGVPRVCRKLLFPITRPSLRNAQAVSLATGSCPL